MLTQSLIGRTVSVILWVMVDLAEIISRAHRVVALAVLGASLPLSTVNSVSRTHASSHISSRIRV